MESTHFTGLLIYVLVQILPSCQGQVCTPATHVDTFEGLRTIFTRPVPPVEVVVTNNVQVDSGGGLDWNEFHLEEFKLEGAEGDLRVKITQPAGGGGGGGGGITHSEIINLTPGSGPADPLLTLRHLHMKGHTTTNGFLVVGQGARAHVEDCFFEGNVATASKGGGMTISGSSGGVNVTRTVFKNNLGGPSGSSGQIWVGPEPSGINFKGVSFVHDAFSSSFATYVDVSFIDIGNNFGDTHDPFFVFGNCDEGFVSEVIGNPGDLTYNLPVGTTIEEVKTGPVVNIRCSACPAGKWHDDQDDSCIRCVQGKFSSLKAATSELECQTCQPGATSPPGSEDESACALCSPGKSLTSPEDGGNCEFCQKGTHSSAEGAATCDPCPPGTYAADLGSTDCTPCPAGEWNMDYMRRSCSGCSAGRYSNSTGLTKSSDCLPCSPGNYSVSGSIACTPCPQGKYSGSSQRACDECEGGSVPTFGQKDCEQCPGGTYARAGDAACSQCESGRYSEVVVNVGSGNSGDGGSSPPDGGGRRLPEGDGSSPPDGGGSSPPDGGGSSPPDGGGSSPPDGGGITINDRGAISCSECKAGTYPNGNQTRCINCGIGHYSSKASPNCTVCPENSVAPQVGQGMCVPCDEDEYIKYGSQECTQISINKVAPLKDFNTEGGETLTILGTGFGGPSDSMLVQLSNGQTCAIDTKTTNAISCIMPPGAGENIAVKVKYASDPNNVFGEATGTLSYAPPEIHSISGCELNSKDPTSTLDCNTVGGDTITIVGSNFGLSQLVVKINMNLCTNVTHDDILPDRKVTCITPPGAGKSVIVELEAMAVSGRSSKLSYKVPTVLSYSGCPSELIDGQQTISCPRQQTVGEDGSAQQTVITVTGNNFGPSHAYVVVAGRLCMRADPPEGFDADDYHTTAFAVLEPGSGSKQRISVLQVGGELSDGNGILDYKACEPGHMNLYNEVKGYYECVECNPGSYARGYDALACEQCPSNFFTLDTQHCEACPDNEMSSAGARSCECKPGFVRDSATNSCLCPPGYQLNQATEMCDLCAVGYYKEALSNSWCESCQDHMSTSLTLTTGAKSSDLCLCPSGTYKSLNQTCVDCVDGMACSDVGNEIYSLRLEEGFWRQRNESTDVRECPKTSLCKGGLFNETCPEYNTGPYCSVCVEGSGGNWESVCHSCDESEVAMGSVAGSLGTLLVILVVTLLVIKYCFPPKSRQAMVHMSKIVIAGMQIMSAIPQVFDVSLPDIFSDFLTSMNFVNLDIFGQISAGCVAEINYFDVLFFTTSIPLLLGSILCLCYLLQRLFLGLKERGGERREHQHKRLKNMYCAFLFLLSYLSYPGASIATFTIFPCDNIEGVEYLKAGKLLGGNKPG